MPSTFTLIFLLALFLSAATRLWLTQRHISHIQAHREKVPAEFAADISLAEHQKAADYTISKNQLSKIALLTENCLLLTLTLGGGLTTLSQFLGSHLQGYIYGLTLIISTLFITSIVDLPLSLWQQLVIEEKFGFNRMNLKTFLIDLFKKTTTSLIIGIPALLIILWFMEASGPLWWLYVWLFWSGLNLLLLFVYPRWIAPLFNTFTPLPTGQTRHLIEALLQRSGFSNQGLWVMDGSRRSTHGNAYFTGLGKNKRIVLFDTLLNRLQPEETEAVLAHELGHFKHRHITQRVLVLFALSFAFLALLSYLISSPWFYSGLGVSITSESNTPLALIIFFLLLPTFTFFFTPLVSSLSRRQEFQADQYAVQQSSGKNLITALVKLYRDNASTLTPDPLHSLFYDSHPPAAIRIAHIRALN